MFLAYCDSKPDALIIATSFSIVVKIWQFSWKRIAQEAQEKDCSGDYFSSNMDSSTEHDKGAGIVPSY